MEDSKPTEQDFGFLFIYDFDGRECSEFMMNLLQDEPYNIPCLSKPVGDLTEELTQRCSVLVLIFTPGMESRAESLNFDLLQPDSENSCLIECNGQVSVTNMPNWSLMYTLKETVESQREVLTGLIDLYEEITGNIDLVDTDIDNEYIMDVIPTVLYPGQTKVHIIFNYETADVTVSVQRVAERIRARKFHKTVFVFNIPPTCLGRTNINIFLGDQDVPVYSTSIIILNPEILAESLTMNICRVLGSPDSEEIKRDADSYLDPFSKSHCTDGTLFRFVSNFKQLVDDRKSQKGAVIREQKPEKKKPEEDKPEVATERAATKNKSTKNKITKFFKKMFQNDPEPYGEIEKKEPSKRTVLASSQKFDRFPRFPEKK